MKKNHLLLIALLLGPLFLKSQEWYRQELLNLAHIDFPSKPDFLDTLGQTFYRHIDDSSIYLVTIQDVSKQSNLKIKPSELNEFYNGIVRGIIDASKGKLVKKSEFTIDNLKGIDIEFTSTANPNLPDLIYKRIIFLNSTILSFDYWTFSRYKSTSDEAKTKFFNTIKISKSKTIFKQYTTTASDTAYNLGYTLGKLVAFLVTLCLIAGIIYFIIDVSKK